jgi:hypothetical protein
MVVILPSVGAQPFQGPGFAAPRTVPTEDATGQQLFGVGRGLERAGATARIVGQELQDEYDANFVKQLDTQLSEALRKRVGEYRQLAGGKAIDAQPRTIEELDKVAGKLGELAQNPEQRELFASLSAQKLADARSLVEDHGRKENRSFAMGQAQARLQESEATFSLYAGTGNESADAAANQARLTAEQEVNALAELEGWAPEQREAMLRQSRDRMHGVVLERLVQQAPSAAISYLEGIRSEVSPQFLARAERVTKTAGVQDRAQRLADELEAKGANLTERMDLLQQQWQSGAIDVDVRDAARRRLREAEHDRREEQAYAINQLEREAREWSAANPLKSLDDNPLLLERARSLGVEGSLRQIESGRPRRTDPEFERMLQDIPIETLRQMSDQQLTAFLGQGLSDRDANARFQFVRGKQEIRTREERMKSWGRRLDIVPKSGKWSDADQEVYNKWVENVEDEVNKLRDKRGRDLTDAEIENEVMAPKLRNKVYLEEVGFNPEMTLEAAALRGRQAEAYVMVGGKKVFLGDVPEDRRDEIVATYRRTNPNGAIDAIDIVQAWLRMGSPGPGDTRGRQAADRDASLGSWPAFSRPTGQSLFDATLRWEADRRSAAGSR